MHRPPATRGARLGILLCALLAFLITLLFVAPPPELAWAVPGQDDGRGTWSDSFGSTDTAPGRSLYDGRSVTFEGTPEDGALRLVAPPLPDEERTLLQLDWSGGAVSGPQATVLFQAGFGSVSSNLLYQNFPGRIVMAPLVGEQAGARPVERFPITPIKTMEDVVGYYRFDGTSTTAAIPSQSKVSNLFFHRDLTTGELSFLLVHNEKSSTGAEAASVRMVVAGLPEGTTLALSDNAGAFTLADGTAVGTWGWDVCCSEGGALRLPAPPFDFTVHVEDPALPLFDTWVQTYTWRVYSEADTNAFPFTLLSKPTQAVEPEPREVSFHGSRTGRLDSVVFDLGALPENGSLTYGTFRFEADVPEGATLRFRFRVGDTAEELEGSAWSEPLGASDQELTPLVGRARRFFQYRAIFSLPDPAVTSQLASPEPLIALRRVELPFTRSFSPLLEPEGEAVSVLIDPRPNPALWQRVQWEGDDQGNPENLRIDVLDGETLEVLREGVAPDTDISDLDPEAHPTLRLRARLRAEQPWPWWSPLLESWRVTWIADRDGDGLPNEEDSCPLFPNPRQEDADGDGVGDACDLDVDGDGVEDREDLCPLDPDAEQLDNDDDGEGDVCDSDDDNDGFLDRSDTCPLIPNPDQADLDGDGAGDVCDEDTDGDGIPDSVEAQLGSDPRDDDSDDDGVIDGQEPGWDEGEAGARGVLDPDADGDGLPDGVELGVVTPARGTDLAAGHFRPDADPNSTTDPRSADTDGDDLPDGVEDADQDGQVGEGESDPNDPLDPGEGGVNNGGGNNTAGNNTAGNTDSNNSNNSSNNGASNNTPGGGAGGSGGAEEGCATAGGRRGSLGGLGWAVLAVAAAMLWRRRATR